MNRKNPLKSFELQLQAIKEKGTNVKCILEEDAAEEKGIPKVN